MATRVIGLVAGLALLGGVASAGSLNGSAGAMPAFYDGTLFTINFKELPAGGGGAAPAQKGAIKTIYMWGAGGGGLPRRQSFVSGVDAIHGDGLHPLWPEGEV